LNRESEPISRDLPQGGLKELLSPANRGDLIDIFKESKGWFGPIPVSRLFTTDRRVLGNEPQTWLLSSLPDRAEWTHRALARFHDK
jgi:hypothetical protein